MKTSSRILVSLALCSTLGFSGIVSGVSIIINKEPITLYEVYKYSKKYNLSKKEALDVLVRQKLENAQIKKLRISASDFEVDNYIEKIATQNNMSPFEFFNMLKEKGINEEQYRKDLKQKIKVEKLYAQIYREKLTSIKEDDVKSFYEKNLDQFKIANKFDIVIYSSKNEEDLKALKKNPMLKPEGVQIKAETLTSNKLNDQLKALLSTTKDGTFTDIINLGGNPTMFYVKSKADIKTIPFENAKNNIYRLLSNKQEQEALKDYFEKLKASANIQVIRNPS